MEAGTSSSPALPISFTSAGVVAEPKGGLTHVNFFKESEAGNAEEKANQERKKEEKEDNKMSTLGDSHNHIMHINYSQIRVY